MHRKSSWLGLALAGLSLLSGRTHAHDVAAVSVCLPGAFFCLSSLSSRAHMTDSLTRALSVCVSLSTSLSSLARSLARSLAPSFASVSWLRARSLFASVVRWFGSRECCGKPQPPR